MKRAKMWRSMHRLLLLPTAAILLSACFGGDDPQAQGELPPLDVVVQPVQVQDIIVETELPGRTVASVVAEIRPQVGGIILEQNFSEGSMVEKDETLYQIDPGLFEANLMQAEATLVRAKANHYAAQMRAERINALKNSKAISRQDVDDANAVLSQSEAEVSSAEAQVKTAQINLNYTKMLAPITGQIGRSNFTQGALVAPGQPKEMAVIQQLDPMHVDITFSSAEFLDIQRRHAEGTLTDRSKDGHYEVRLTLDNGQEYEHVGHVRFSDRTVDQTTGSIFIQAEFPNPDMLLLPGMFVRSKVEQGLHKDAMLVPQRAVQRDLQGNATVMVVGENNQLGIVPVVTEYSYENNWVITSGLKGDERIIVDGFPSIQGRMRQVQMDISKVALNPMSAEEAKAKQEAAGQQLAP